jgi:5-methyltetrahydrofolate--homocysteine methyltransferase
LSIQAAYDAILNFDSNTLVKEVEKEVAQGTDVSVILAEGLINAMDEVGRRYSSGEFFVPEMLMSARTMKVGLDYLKPYLAQTASEKKGVIVIGTVKGDLHDIGKNLVAMMLEGGGFEVIDIGVNVETEKFIAAIQEKKADIVCLSALLTTTMGAMEESVRAIKNQALTVRIMVGGAPVNQEFADQIGADGYSGDAAGAVEIARKLVAK